MIEALAIVERYEGAINYLYPEQLTRFLASWRGHAKWADTYNLLQRMEVAA